MNLFKRIFSICLMIALVFSFTIVSYAADDNAQQDPYTINKPYSYPVLPGTTQWKSFKTHAEKLSACQIPNEILQRMSTEALVETVLNYPLMADMLAFDTIGTGYEAVKLKFNGLQELETRPDAATYLVDNQNNAVTTSGQVNSSVILRSLYIDVLQVSLGAKTEVGLQSVITPMYTVTTVPTPRGTPVTAYYDLTWTDLGVTEADCLAAQAQYAILYPDSSLISAQSPKYNCHSYAWYSASTSNKYWIDNPIAYMTDGSYSSGTAAAGKKVFYDSAYGSKYDHSGIVTGVSGYNVGVRSKWGPCGLYTHRIYDCPYSDYSPVCTFWG